MCTSVSLTINMKASSGSGQLNWSQSWATGCRHAAMSTAEELCLMGTAPVCSGCNYKRQRDDVSIRTFLELRVNMINLSSHFKMYVMWMKNNDKTVFTKNRRALLSITWSTCTAFSTLSIVVLKALFNQYGRASLKSSWKLVSCSNFPLKGKSKLYFCDKDGSQEIPQPFSEL